LSAATAAALNHSANFFDGWLNVLDKRRQQVLGMIAATDGLSATAPQGAFYVFANCQALMGRMTPGGEILRNDSALANWLL
ncbi:aspartate transaminase, partial [Klebsiella pneumoniae]|nr:aspartate transaminase [Klebsiella pneumoniae]